MKTFFGGWFAFVLLATVGVARAEVTLNLKDAEISTLIQTVSEVTGKNFIVDPRVKGKVTVISASPMNEDGLYETFLAVLQVQGFAAIPSGDTIKIVPETNARQDGGGYSSAGGLAIDEVVTHVYPIQNVSAAQLVPILRPLVPQWGHLAAYAPSNMLIISDRAANVQRLEKLIRQIDLSGDRGIEVIKLEYASATEVVRVLTSLTQGDKQAQADPGAQRPVAVIADERSNSILIGGDRTERVKLIEIVTRLDVPVGEDGATQVVYLKYASAENLAPILEGYAQQVSQPAGGGAPAASAAPASASSGPNANGVRVLADKDTNALIITAPPKTMRQVRDVISQLDIRRAQVLVEGIIAEVSASKSSALGIDWAVFNDNRIAAAGLLDPASLAAVQALGAVGGSSSSANSDLAALGLLGNGINVVGGRDGGRSGTSFALLLKAIKGDGDSNVLSTPTLVTLDNEEAEISVGQEVPFLTGSFSNTGATGGSTLNPFQTIERKDVGLTLGITPQINEGDNIKLKLKLEVSSLVTGSTGGAVDLVTNKRTLTNTVSVEDGQVLVLGGLIDDNVNDTQRGVPFLSDIPIIGSLFRYRSVANQKRNLMVFIKPAILRKQSEGDYYSRIKYESIRDLQRSTSAGTSSTIGGNQRIVLDPYDAYAARDAEFRARSKAEAAAEAAGQAKPEAPGAAADAGPAPTAPQPLAPEPILPPAQSEPVPAPAQP